MIRDRATSEHRNADDPGHRGRTKGAEARTPLLAAEEEAALADRIKAGDQDARRELILANLRLVVEIALRYRSAKVPMDDLIQEGNLGLIRASADFDPSVHGRRFSTYAGVWIKAFIHRSLIANNSLIRVPQQVFLRRRKERRDAGAAPAGGASESPRVSRCSVDDEGEVVPLTDTIVDDRPPDLLTAEQEMELRLEAALRDLNPVEAWIIRERYGVSLTIPEERNWNGRGARPSRRDAPGPAPAGVPEPRREGNAYYHRSYSDLSRDCGLTRRRIAQVEEIAIEKLRDALHPHLARAGSL